MAVLRPSFWRSLRSAQRAPRCNAYLARQHLHRAFQTSSRLDVVKPFLLADIGEGITECQLIQWFVQPGARVEQFDKLCEVQSDKASVEITSPFDGVIKKLYYEPDDMAITGKPLVDIDIQSEISEADAAKLAGGAEEGGEDSGKEAADQGGEEASQEQEAESEGQKESEASKDTDASQQESSKQQQPRRSNKKDMGSLATPAVRHLVKEHKLDIEDVDGTGRDGRVLKEDVHRHVAQQSQGQSSEPAPSAARAPSITREDKKTPLSNVQNQMFKAMTKSLNIPHFLYTCSTDMTAVTILRKKLNVSASPERRITPLSFVLKALSMALTHHPLLNSSLDTKDANKPQLTIKGAHNIGIAVDTAVGLLVPVMRNVQDLSITEIGSQLREISERARNNKLGPKDFSGATFTVSNIGSVGGGVVAPVISEPQVAIMGIGRSKVVPAFDEDDNLIKKEELVLSWSADHRVVDGAECARCAEKVKGLLEDPTSMLVELR